MSRLCLVYVFPLLVFTGARLHSQVINELMAWNTNGLTDPDYGLNSDWIEIYNDKPVTLVMSDYYLSDNGQNKTQWRFPPGVNLTPGAYLLVWADGTGESSGHLHASFKLDVGGEEVFLMHGNGTVVDSVSYPRQFQDVSYGKDAGKNWRYFSNPTPGQANDESSGYLIASGLTFSPPPGWYPSARTVSILSSVPGAVIYYTLDGSEPDQGDQLYTGPVPVTGTRVIRARAYAPGYQPGWTETASYLIVETLNLPVVSLSTGPANLWDNTIGIYVTGTNGIPGYCSEEPRNWNQDWERPVSVEFFDRDGHLILQADAGTKIFGGCSRGFPLKSLSLIARNEYGGNEFRYPFFREKNINSFKGLVLRNSGNDFYNTMFRDAAMQAIVSTAMDVDYQAYEPCIAFLNGQYWGILNLREKLNEHYLASNFGLEPEQTDMLELNMKVISGDKSHYQSLITYLQQNNLSSQSKYEHVTRLIDIDEYINYLIVQMYYANTDWPGNNLKYWRPRREGGKWRWILFDLDFGLGLYGNAPSYDMFQFTAQANGPEWPNPPWSTYLYRKLLESPSFRNTLVQRFSNHLNTTFQPDRIDDIVDSLKAGIEAEMPRHINRWGAPGGGMTGWNNQIGNMKSWARQRNPHLWQQMASRFNGGYQVTVGLYRPAPDSGRININGMYVAEPLFTGTYLSGIPLNLRASPGPGKQFARWEVGRYQTAETRLINLGEIWKYNDTGVYPGSNWNNVSYDDSAWPSGPAELGYGDGDEATVLQYGGDPANKHISYYFRKTFQASNVHNVTGLALEVVRDDGIVVYLNGEEILRDNMPVGTIGHTTASITYVGGDDESRVFLFYLPSGKLVEGNNVIAAEVHQSDPGSSDISFNLGLSVVSAGNIEYSNHYGQVMELLPDESMLIRAFFEELNEIPQLRINEIMASNQSAFQDDLGKFPDWIEIYNAGEQDVNIAGFFITDNLSRPEKWVISDSNPGITVVPANGFIVLFADNDTLQGPLHLGFALSKDGEEVGLSGMIGGEFTWFDQMSFGPQQTDVSFGRYPDGYGPWYSMSVFTPGEPNLPVAVASRVNDVLPVRVFPNPTTGLAFLVIGGQDFMAEDLQLSCYDLNGRLVLTKTFSQVQPGQILEIDLTNARKGMYLVRVVAGMQQYTLRLIKQ